MRETEITSLEGLLSLYLALPHTPSRASREDRRLARELEQRQIPWDALKTALLLATARRCLRDPSLQPLPPIRSLPYCLPIIEEVLGMEISPDYVRYLKRKLAASVSPDHFSD